MCVTGENLKCVPSTCRLLGWPCGHFQHSGLLQTTKLLEKATDGNASPVRRLQHFQNPCDNDIGGHGMQVCSFDRTSRQPFCAQKPVSSSFSLAIVYKVALTATDSVHYSRLWTVNFILLFWLRKKTVDGQVVENPQNTISQVLAQNLEFPWQGTRLTVTFSQPFYHFLQYPWIFISYSTSTCWIWDSK